MLHAGRDSNFVMRLRMMHNLTLIHCLLLESPMQYFGPWLTVGNHPWNEKLWMRGTTVLAKKTFPIIYTERSDIIMDVLMAISHQEGRRAKVVTDLDPTVPDTQWILAFVSYVPPFELGYCQVQAKVLTHTYTDHRSVSGSMSPEFLIAYKIGMMIMIKVTMVIMTVIIITPTGLPEHQMRS